jgi:hypothetical protein
LRKLPLEIKTFVYRVTFVLKFNKLLTKIVPVPEIVIKTSTELYKNKYSFAVISLLPCCKIEFTSKLTFEFKTKGLFRVRFDEIKLSLFVMMCGFGELMVVIFPRMFITPVPVIFPLSCTVRKFTEGTPTFKTPFELTITELMLRGRLPLKVNIPFIVKVGKISKFELYSTLQFSPITKFKPVKTPIMFMFVGDEHENINVLSNVISLNPMSL